jgi:Tubulin-tyrosine ligase family
LYRKILCHDSLKSRIKVTQKSEVLDFFYFSLMNFQQFSLSFKTDKIRMSNKKTTNKKTLKPEEVSKIAKYYSPLKKILLVCFGIYLSWLVYNLNNEYVVQIKLKSELNSEPKNTEVDVQPEEIANSTAEPLIIYEKEPRPKYWFYMARGYMWIFFSIDNALQKLGLEKIEINVIRNETIPMDWNLLWSYDYFQEIPIDYSQLKYHQKINHIPGNYVLCMKDQLSINTKSKFIPPGFNSTQDLKEYASKNKNARFLQKLWSNRGIQLKAIDEIEFSMFGPGFKYFAQLYVENPLLIEGHKFDFGIYVLVTSIDPLRVYYYNKNTLIRLCEKKYNPKNYSDVDTYVISDACLFPWDVDALSVYYNQSYTHKESLNAYLTKKGYDVNRIWSQVEECIREIVLSKEKDLKFWVNNTTMKRYE